MLFASCSILGWIYETVLEVFIYKTGFSNRGFLNGPYCVVYGFGAVILFFFLNRILTGDLKLISKILICFILIVIISTGVELAASYLMEYFTGSWMWNYERFTPNFEGRIALNPSIRFGVGGLFIFFVILPLLLKIQPKARDFSATVLTLIIAIDGIITIFLQN